MKRMGRRMLALLLCLSLSAALPTLCAAAAPQTLLQDDFSHGAADWTLTDADGDGYGWYADTQDGNTAMYSDSLRTNADGTDEVLAPNNAMTSPRCFVAAGTDTLRVSWQARTSNASSRDYYAVTLNVYEDGEIAATLPLYHGLAAPEWTETAATVDAEPLIGKEISVTFCHRECEGRGIVGIDDVCLRAQTEKGDEFYLSAQSERRVAVYDSETPVIFRVGAENLAEGETASYKWYACDAYGQTSGSLLSTRETLQISALDESLRNRTLYYCAIAYRLSGGTYVEQSSRVFSCILTDSRHELSQLSLSVRLPAAGMPCAQAEITLPAGVRCTAAQWDCDSYTPTQPCTLTLRLSAEDGYAFCAPTVTVNGQNAELLSAARQYIELRFVFSPLPFSDLTAGSWYYEAVRFCWQTGLMQGTGSGFAPEMTLSRAQLVQILYAKADKPAVSEITSSFSDVQAGQWYAEAVTWAVETGVAAGYNNGIFGAKDPVTREQIAVMLRSFARVCGTDVTAGGSVAGFADADSVSRWAKDAVSWALANRLLSGKQSGGVTRLAPQDSASRAETAVILLAFCTNISGDESAPN